MSDSIESAPLRLTETEQVVHDRLTERESHASAPRLADAYLRILGLSRSGDPIDGVLAAHLVRELLAALPRVAGVGPIRGHTDYESHVRAIADVWPDTARRAPPPKAAVVRLQELLEDHDRASNRARASVDGLLRALDPGRAAHIPDASVTRWLDLARRGSGFAHAIKETERELPDPDAIRRLADELTTTLFAALAPWFVAIEEVDRRLAARAPTAHDASVVLRLLTTQSQVRYFYDRADARWLRPLAAVDRGFTHPPGLIEMEDGWLAPDWPQGRYLARVGGLEPEEVRRLASRVSASDNPLVVQLLVKIARALPSSSAATLVPWLCSRLATPIRVEYLAVEIAKLVEALANGGHPDAAARLFLAAARHVSSLGRERSWHLERVLGPTESVAGSVGTIGPGIWKLLDGALRKDRARRRYSKLWLRNIDRRPGRRVDNVWLLANAAYRLLLAGPLEHSAQFAATLLARRDAVARRVALAAIADRPDLLKDPDDLILQAAIWDEAGSTRYEYRRALGAAWPRASELARSALLAYAAEAAEAGQIIDRLDIAGIVEPADEVIRGWRSRLLHRIADQLPDDWLQEFGPLDVVAEDRLPEASLAWRGTSGPIEETELAALDVDGVIALLANWSEPTERSCDAPTLEGLAGTAGEVIPSRLEEFAPLVDRIVLLRPQILAAITGGIERAMRGGQLGNPHLGVQFVLDLAEHLQPTSTDDQQRQVLRDVAGTVTLAANKELLEPQAFPRARSLLRRMLEEEPAGGWNDRSVSEEWDAGLVALNTLRGEVATALLELMFEARRLGLEDEFQELSGLLRQGVLHPDGAIPIRASIGMRLPWLLGHDVGRQAEWVECLLGSDVPAAQRDACFQGYLLYARIFSESVELLRGAYGRAVVELAADDNRDRGLRDEREHLGIHVAWAHLTGSRAEAEEQWLATFFSRAPDAVRAHVARWIAEQAASDDSDEGARNAARAFLRARVVEADPSEAASELDAVSWVAPAVNRSEEVLIEIILPALEKTRGRTENESGVAELAARLAQTQPLPAARALRLLVEGDELHSLPHVAADPLRRGLETLMASNDGGARRVAEETIHTLGAQGFLEYRNLLNRAGRAAGDQRPQLH